MSKTKISEVIRLIDWSKLSDQKIVLLEVMDSPHISKEQVDSLDGILNLVDRIQDFTVLDGTMPQSIVFPPRDKNGKQVGLGEGVIVDADGDDEIENDFKATVEDITDEGYVVVKDEQDKKHTIIESNNYLTRA